jgi:uncharacterized protein
MRYNVAQLLRGQPGAQKQHDLDEQIRQLDPELEPIRPLVGTVSLMRTSQGILATGKLHTRLRTVCRRCLEPCAADVEFALEEEFYPVDQIGEAPLDRVLPEDRDEAVSIDGQHILDLSEVVRQGLWLAMPQDALCRPDCGGLCHDCGGNRNLGECQCDQATVDPRWAALQTLLTEESESEERSD